VEVFQLPPYWPELNATERIWNYTRKHVTHNRFFERPHKIFAMRSSTISITCDIIPRRSKTSSIPFFNQHVELFMRAYIVLATLISRAVTMHSGSSSSLSLYGSYFEYRLLSSQTKRGTGEISWETVSISFGCVWPRRTRLKKGFGSPRNICCLSQAKLCQEPRSWRRPNMPIAAMERSGFRTLQVIVP
jgi:hypothetical protein